jgi:predicted nucleotidyltransferase
MRLTDFERRSISEVVHSYLPDARVLLFGSRVDDTTRGGDIDLLVLNAGEPDWQLKWQISEDIQQRIGEQKIDLVIEDPASLSLFARTIIDEAITLRT